MNNHDSSISSVDTVSTADNILRSGCRILKKIAESTDKQNIVFSPFGISSALAITYNGALDETAREMSNVFGFAEVDRECSAYRNLINSLCLEEEGRTLKIANSLWIDREFTSVINDDFVNRGTESFSASIYHVDFKDEATTALVNAWVSNATQGKIDHLVKDTKNIDTAIINAVYFEADWADSFDANSTFSTTFYTGPNQPSVDCRMMAKTEWQNYLRTDNAQIAFLPYKSSDKDSARLSMAVLLPDQGKSLLDCLDSLESIFESESKTESVFLRLQLPRFRVSFDMSLVGVCRALGMNMAFDQKLANFSGMCPNFYITEILHKAILEVGEKGTVAAAATIVEMRCGGMYVAQPDPVEMIVNRPFLVAIIDTHTRVPLFIGGITKPEELI